MDYSNIPLPDNIAPAKAATSVAFTEGPAVDAKGNVYFSDIINNRITQETIARQDEILTRLLEAEKAEREQEEDDKRKSTEWNFSLDNTTQEYLDYKKQEQQQEELLKTTPVQLKPYYKKRVNTYFNTLIKKEK